MALSVQARNILALQRSIASQESLKLKQLVEEQLVARGISNAEVLAAFRTVPRSRFVPPKSQESAFQDAPVYIGEGQTVSQPYIVAFMLEQLDLAPNYRVLEVGSGSGYVLALLATIVREVVGVEIVAESVLRARQLLVDLALEGVEIHCGDGRLGSVAEAPFDRILVSAASDQVPSDLIAQLKIGGKAVIPLECKEGGLGGRAASGGSQRLVKITKNMNGLTEDVIGSVRFVPLVYSS